MIRETSPVRRRTKSGTKDGQAYPGACRNHAMTMGESVLRRENCHNLLLLRASPPVTMDNTRRQVSWLANICCPSAFPRFFGAVA